MKVVFLQDVQGVALGGEVKEVKNGFARNCLLPKHLAVPAGHNALRRVQRLTQHAEAQRLKVLVDMEALAQELDGTQVNVEMRAGASGRLYGSVTNAIVAAELSRMTDQEIDRRTVEIAEPIRDVGVYDVRVRLHAEVDGAVKVVVYPTGSDPAEVIVAAEAAASAKEAEAEADESAGAPAQPPTETMEAPDLDQRDDETEELAQVEQQPGDAAGPPSAEKAAGDAEEVPQPEGTEE